MRFKELVRRKLEDKPPKDVAMAQKAWNLSSTTAERRIEIAQELYTSKLENMPLNPHDYEIILVLLQTELAQELLETQAKKDWERVYDCVNVIRDRELLQLTSSDELFRSGSKDAIRNYVHHTSSIAKKMHGYYVCYGGVKYRESNFITDTVVHVNTISLIRSGILNFT